MRYLKSGVVALSLASMAWAGGVAGKWKMTASAPDGNTYKVELVVKEDGGKLAATLESERGTMPLEEVALNGGELTFKLEFGSGPIPFKLKVDGDTMKGTLTLPNGGTGSVTAAREGAGEPAAAAATATVAGKWQISSKDAEGNQIKATLELKQDGEKLSGQIALENGDAAPVSDGKISGGEFTFKITGEGEYEVSGSVSGGQMKGTYKTPNGSKGTFTGTR